MTCHNCQSQAVKIGTDRKGNQRYRCTSCRKTFGEKKRQLANMYLSFDKALLVLQLLVEGMSIRSTERITGVEKKTILNLLVLAGERLMENKLRKVKVNDLQLDEIWAYVGMKEKTKKRKGKDETTLGD